MAGLYKYREDKGHVDRKYKNKKEGQDVKQPVFPAFEVIEIMIAFPEAFDHINYRLCLFS